MMSNPIFNSFGINDANTLISFFDEESIYHKEEKLIRVIKVFFFTKYMYQKYDEICLINSTYKVNKYSAPLLSYQD